MAEDSAVEKTVETSSKSDEVQALESATEVAEDNVDALRTRLKEFEDRLTKEGRSKAQIKAESEGRAQRLEAALKDLADSKKKVEQWNEYYFTKVAPAEERVAYQRTQAARQQQEQMTVGQREAMWKAIAEEDDPSVRSALRDSAAAGEYLGPAAINAIRKTLTLRKQDAENEKTEEKEPPKISATRTGTSTGKATLEQQLEEVKGNKKLNKQDKAQEIVALYSQISARDAARNRA